MSSMFLSHPVDFYLLWHLHHYDEITILDVRLPASYSLA